MKPLILANARLISDNQEFSGTIQFDDTGIISIDNEHTSLPNAINCGTDYVCAGLIELHTDNLEGHLQPRPHVHWPHNAAILAHDSELASVGITTVLDAVPAGPEAAPFTNHLKASPVCQF